MRPSRAGKRLAVDETDRDRGDDRREHAAEHRHGDIGGEHDRSDGQRRTTARPQTERSEGTDDEQRALRPDIVDQGADRGVEHDAGQAADREHGADRRLAPMRSGDEIDDHIGAEPAADVREEEVDPVQSNQSHGPTTRRKKHDRRENAPRRLLDRGRAILSCPPLQPKSPMATDVPDFYAAVPVFDSFVEVMAPASYRPLPEDWSVGFADVVGSTQAIAEGRYKAVNMVGAGVIAAVANALERRPFPFVFGGDGASFAVSAGRCAAAAEALAAMAVFAREELQMELRVAMVPVTSIRAAGRDVRVARFAASQHCSYAMFAGGGLPGWRREAKRGAFALPPPRPARARICRVSPAASRSRRRRGA